ncbi:MAG TPA: c-type cytochrome [Lutibacter sp.]
MKKHLLLFNATIAVFLLFATAFIAQDNGEITFKQICAACHTIGKGRLVGPDLANVDQRRPEEWIIRFVKSSQTVIKGGDKYADSLFNAFNQMPMPDNPNLNDSQIKEIIAYIKLNSAATAIAESTTITDALTGDAKRGQELFVGNIRFANNGPACNSCHNVNLDGFISGGSLAKDLTQSVTRLTVAGVSAVVSLLPFPQMKQAYETRPLTPQEVADITSFLKYADKVTAAQAISSVGNKMLIGGIIGVVALLILFSFFWMKRKQQSVNYAIYKRQLKSF